LGFGELNRLALKGLTLLDFDFENALGHLISIVCFENLSTGGSSFSTETERVAYFAIAGGTVPPSAEALIASFAPKIFGKRWNSRFSIFCVSQFMISRTCNASNSALMFDSL
jgi:hypothetical protein